MNTKKTILLVDDEVSIQKLAAMTLESEGYQVVVAGNGLEAMEALKTVKPDVIVLDLNMPKMGGVEFYQRICNVAGKPMYPVLVLTARANMEQLFRSFNIAGFMAKPFEIDDLLKEIKTIIDASQNIAAARKYFGARKVCLIEDDPKAMKEIGTAFVGGGFLVDPVISGLEGIERVFNTVPDLVLVKLNLADLSGDLVILKLKMMAKRKV